MKLKFLTNLLEYAIFSLSILLAFLILFEKYLVLPALVSWIGHWHPLILHFPIVLIFITILQYWRKDKYVRWYLGVTTLFALISSLTGFILSTENAVKGDQILTHQWAAIGVTALLVIWWHLYSSLDKKVSLVKGMQLTLAGLIIITGHIGGTITHGENFLSFRKDEAGVQLTANPAIYSSFVQPIFNDKCTQCHNVNKSKGKLILSDYLSLASGGEFGPGLDFIDLGKSSLKYHIELPLEDEFHMPPSDEEQLTEVELMILNDWLLAGASDTLTLAGLKEESRLFTYVKNKQSSGGTKLYDHLPEVSDEKLQNLSSNYIAINRIYHGSEAVSVDVFANATYDPSQLKPLSAISKNIVSLNLNSILVGDQEIAFIKSCPNLEKLNLSNTPVNDIRMESLGKSNNLKSLNLFNTAVTDASVPAIAALPKLVEIFIYGTQLSETGLEKLRKSNEKLMVISASEKAQEFSSVLPPATVTPLKHFFAEPFKIDITHPLAGIDIYYATDGSMPNTQSAKFTEPLLMDRSTKIKYLAVKEGWESSRVDSVQMIYAGVKPDSMYLLHLPDVKYAGRGVYQLTDLQKGPESYSDSAWMAYREKDFVLWCSWNADVSLNEIILSSLVKTDSYLFSPESITIKAGKDKNGLKTIYYKKLDGLRDRKNSLNEYYYCSFDSQEVRYVEIIVRPLSKIPLWHQGVGQKGWFFIDEVVFVQPKSMH